MYKTNLLHRALDRPDSPRRPSHLARKGLWTLVFACLPLCLASSGLAEETDPVAKVGDDLVTLAELESAVEAQLKQLETQRHALLEGALDGLIDKRLLQREAIDRGITLDQLLEQEVTSKAPPVADSEIDTWYSQNRSRLGTNTKEQLAPQIRTFLEQQAGAQQTTALLAKLRAKYPVEVYFEPLRHELDLSNATWKGPENAPVTVVEFSDFQCPACQGFNPTVSQLLAAYPEQVRIAFLQSPLRQIHPQAQDAAEASLCAREQNKFWEFHDALFADQSKLQIADLKSTARLLGMNGEAFDACLDGDTQAGAVQADLNQAARVGASGTPSVFVNGRPTTPGRVPSLETLKELIDDELARGPAAK
jgi:protein-disulfide isomerase